MPAYLTNSFFNRSKALNSTVSLLFHTIMMVNSGRLICK